VTDKLNIGFIEDTPLHGGTQIWVREATGIFLSMGHNVTVITPENSWVYNECKKIGADVNGYDYEKITEENPRNEINKWKSALEKCDIAVCTVHPPRDGFHCSVFAAKVIREFNLKTILIPKTGTIVPEYKREFYLPDPLINSHVITITDFTRKYLIENYNIPKEGISLIYQGTDISSFKPDNDIITESKKRYLLPDDIFPVIGNIGSFEKRKGQSVLLESFKNVLKVFPKAFLIFVGDGPDEKMLKAKVSDLNISDSVKFFPFTREPNYVYGRIDMLTLPSLYKEGLPNVLLESLAMEIPVIASNIAGIPEIVIDEKTGFLTEPGNIKKLTDLIIKMASDRKKMKNMGIAGRKYVIENFDKSRQFNMFLDFFSKISK